MSTDKNQTDRSSCCASCGVAEVDGDIKLKECVDCDLVRYCSDECQKNHKLQHEEACKKRVAELRDELLFKQPESTYLGDCPICCLPMPLDVQKSATYQCCSKVVCISCYYISGRSLQHRCPFCREPTPSTEKECEKQIMKRVEANDPVALCEEGVKQYVKADYSSAFEYFTRAAGLGDMEAQYQLSRMYDLEKGIEKDGRRGMHHLKEAAIGGHPSARCGLGFHEYDNGNIERAVKHWIIAAAQGHDDSIKFLLDVFREEDGMVSKDDLAAALRAHQAAVDSAKCPQREAAEEYYENLININAED